MSSSLIYIPKIKPSARLRLFCFSYAGGSSATYVSWEKLIGREIELALIQLPGRGARLLERPYETMNAIVEDLLISIKSFNDKPRVFFGHSMGAKVAYELTFKLYQNNMSLPKHLLISASPPPCEQKNTDFVYNLSDQKFIERLQAMNGSAQEVLHNDEIMKFLLPGLRADFEIAETYTNLSETVIPTGVSVLAGTEDELKEESLQKWFLRFRYSAGLYWINGDHFFVDRNPEEVLSVIKKVIDEVMIFAGVGVT